MAAVLVLSGGRSSRMGTDKSQLMIDGQTLLQYQVSRFQTAGFAVVSELTDQYPDYQGPLAGILTACLKRPDVDAWLVLPVDVPNFSVATVQFLIAHGRSLAAPVCFQGHPMPVYLPVSRLLIELLTGWLADPVGCRSVRALVNRLNGHWLAADSHQDELFNVNTPQDWQNYISGESA